MTIGLNHVNVKVAHVILKKTITWTKKLKKRRPKWEKACVERELRPRKLNTPMKTKFVSKVIMFEKCLEFKEAIILC